MDLEVGNPLTRRAGALPAKPVYMALRKETIEEFSCDYGIAPITRDPNPGYHPHPHCAYQRNTLEVKAVKLLREAMPTGTLVDVGSAARRVQRMDDNIHAMTPLLHEGDRARQESRLREQWCNHRMEACTCGPFEGALFTHSAYYMSGKDLLAFHKNRLTTRTSYHVVHRFNSAFGSMCHGELKYYYDGDMVVSNVVGNSHTYRHRRHFSQEPTPPFDEEGALVAEQISVLGDTYLFRVEYVFGVKPVGPTVPRNLREAIRNMDTEGEFPWKDQRSKLGAPTTVEIDVDRVLAHGPVLIGLGQEGVKVTLSRHAVDQVAARMLGVPRGPAAWRDALHYANGAYSTHLPDYMKPHASLITAAMAMTLVVNDEVEVLQTVLSRFHGVFRAHSQLLGWVPLQVLPARYAMVVAGVLACVGVSLYVALPEYQHLAGWAVLALAFSLAGLVSCLWCVARAREHSVGRGWVSRLQRTGATSHSDAGFTALDTSLEFPADERITEPLLPPADTGIRITYDQVFARVGRLAPKPAMLGVGVLLDHLAPRVVRSCGDSELSGVANRLLLRTPEPEPEGIRRYQSFIARSEDMARFLSEPIITTDADVRRWCDKYPRRRADELYETWKRVAEKDGLDSRELTVHAFVKLEKKVDVTMDGVAKGATPRMVCAHTDAVLVLTCPMVSLLYDQMRATLDGQGRLFFAPGSSSERVGEVMQEWADRCRAPLYWWVDAEKFDAHIRGEVRDEWGRVLWFKGATPTQYQAFMESGSILRTPHGVIAFIPPQEQRLWSGRGDTNLQGTFDTLALTGGVLEELAKPTEYYGNSGSVFWGSMGCGDDGAGVMDWDGPEVMLIEGMEKMLLQAGFKHTVQVSRNLYDADFCSKLFWPVEGGTRLVLGAKPGRMISRIGYVLIGPNEPNLKGMVVGLLNDNHHVPVLGAFLLHLYSLLKRDKVVRGRSEWDGFHVQRRYACDQSTWDAFRRRYECSQEEAEELQATLLRVERLPALLSPPTLLKRMISRDEL